MNWSNYGRWRHPKQWYELKKKNKVMKKLIQKIKEFLFPPKTIVWNERVGGAVNYSAQFQNSLTGEQIGALLNKSLDKFPPNCKPNRATVGGTHVTYSFSQNCLNSDTLISIIDKTLEGTSPKAVVISVTISGGI